MTEEALPVYGVEAGDQEMTSGGRWPYLRPKDGDRARFHFLTSGNDPWLVATKFHPIGEGQSTRNIVCVSALTRGSEQCLMCEMESGQNRKNMFACWVWVDYILHPHDNPDEEGETWEQKQLLIKSLDGSEKKRSVFMESVDGEDAAKLLWLSAGRKMAWWNQFQNAWLQSQDLRKHFYEIHRVGAKLDTEYTLNTLKEDPLDEKVLDLDGIKNLPSIIEVFRSTLAAMPSGDAVMGSDSLDGAGQSEELPSATAEIPVSSDDLV